MASRLAVALLLLLLVPALAGCAEDGGFFEGLGFGASKTLDGVCGHAYNGDWDRQIIVDITLDKRARADRQASPDGHEVSALYLEPDPPDHYADDRSDDQGCAALPLKGAGGYNFWAFREIPDSNCFLSGYTDGHYNGETPVVAAHIVVTRHCS